MKLSNKIEISQINNNYFIDTLGNVYSRPRPDTKGGMLKYKINPYGYVTVKLYINKKSKTKMLHRLIAESFIPNPENKKEVNHKNGNKLDNSIKNLEWCTPSENIIHAYKTGLRKKKSSTGEKYIYWDKLTNRFRVTVFNKDKTRFHGGRFNTLKEAIRARNKYLTLPPSITRS